MALTLKQQMAADVEDVFLDTDAFADTITWYPKGDMSRGQSILAIVDTDQVEGTREVSGDGRVLHHEKGESLRQTARLEIAASIDITEAPHPKPDKFGISDKTWVVKRVLGSDAAMQTVLVVRQRKQLTRRGQTRG
jgi:hypothetical protein